MQSKLFRITINTAQPDLLLRFYGLLGFQFEQKKVNKGSQSWVGQLGDISLEIFSIKESFSSKSPGVQMSFEVKGLEHLVDQFRQIHAEVMIDPMPCQAGLMAVILDPDGRSVELTQV